MNIRPSHPSDLTSLVDLMARAFEVSPQAPFLRADIMRWKYWDARDDWAEPRSYVVEHDGSLVAHAGIWPSVVTVEGTVRRGIQLLDWASEPSSPGFGTRLLRGLVDMFDFVYGIGGARRARAILPLLGFREIAQSWKAARPLRPWKMAAEPASYQWKLPARLVRNVAWSAVPRSGRIRDWSYEPADPDELSLASERVEEIPREAGFFRYLARCPGCQCVTYRLINRGASKGFFVLMKVRHHARLAVWLEDVTFDTRRVVYSLAQQAARTHHDVFELAVMGSTRTAADAATEAGLRIRATAPVYLLDRNALWHDRAPDIQFQLSDLDSIFFDDGGQLVLC